MRKIFIFTVLSLLFILNKNEVKAQLATFSLGELNSYINAYTEPFANAMPIGLSGGLAHTAKVHNKLGFDITFSTSLVIIPEADGKTSASSISLPPGFEFLDDDVPTIRADKDMPQPTLRKTMSAGGYTQYLDFPAFKGIGMGFTGMAAIQAGIGLPKGTEITGRFIPDISGTFNKVIPDGVNVSLEKTTMWGLGVKHDIKQWIPVVAKVPFLQISGMFNYSKFKTGFSGADLAVTPERLGNLPVEDDVIESWDNQTFKMDISSFTGTLLVGANIPVFQPYIGLGFNSGKFESGFYGTYPVAELYDHDNNITTPHEIWITDSEKDPLVIESKTTNFNFQAGARLKLGVIVFYYQLTVQKYTMHTGGLAVTFR